MKDVSSRFAAYTLLYVSVIFGIFVLQFTKGSAFSLNFSTFTVSGRQEYTESGKSLPLLPVHIISNGLDMYITEQEPVYAVSPETEFIPLKVVTYETLRDRFIVRCSQQVSISFFPETQGELQAVRIEADIPAVFEKILLPWKITQSASLERQNGKIFVRSGRQQFSFTGNFGLNTDLQAASDASEIPHVILAKTQPVAYYRTYRPSQDLDVETIPSMIQASAETYAKAIELFTSAVINERRTAAALKKADEKLVAAYIAEMGRRALFSEALEKAPPQMLTRELRTYLTNPFYNNLQKTHSGLLTAQQKKRELYTALLKEKKNEIFEHEHIIPFLTDNGAVSTVEAFFHYVKTVDAQSLTARQSAGVLEAWLDCIQFYPAQATLFEDVLPICEKNIMTSLVLVNEGLYLLTGSGKYIDSVETLITANILLKYGTRQTAHWQPIGRMLVTSLLQYSGERASLPVGFTLAGEKHEQQGLVADDSSILSAGLLYPLVMSDNSWYPHEKSLTVQSKQKIWAWTCAQEIEVLESTAKTLVLRIRFPVGSSHYLTLHGIKPFYRIEMYGIPFRSDPRFELYNSSGYAYNESAKVLYLKMRHKNEYETIRLSLGNQQRPAVSVPHAAPVESQKPDESSRPPAASSESTSGE